MVAKIDKSVVALSEVSRGKKAKIVEIGESVICPILYSMGVLPEDELEVIQDSFLGSPLFLKGRDGCLFALRKKEASKVRVKII